MAYYGRDGLKVEGEQEAEAILHRALEALNGVFLLDDIKDVTVTDNLHTVLKQHITRSIRSNLVKRPAGRPKQDIKKEDTRI